MNTGGGGIGRAVFLDPGPSRGMTTYQNPLK